MTNPTIRCAWVPLNDPPYVEYHDVEWGVPVFDARRHFEMIVLEGAQAGLSWATILHRRDGYRRAFADFDPAVVARFGADDVERLMYAWSVFLCLPNGLAERTSAATGTVMRSSTLRRYALDAGFGTVQVLDVEHPFFRFYRLLP